MNCQHCLEPLENSRRKNCEFCSTLKVKANKNGTYAQLLKAMDSAAADASLAPAERREIFQATFSGAVDPRFAAKREAEKREEARREAKKQRDHQNSILRGAGFKWEHYEHDEEDQDFFNLPAVEWSLIAPDGREITLGDALKIVRGETTLEAVRGQQQARRDAEFQQAVVAHESKITELETELAEAEAQVEATNGVDETELAKFYEDGRYLINAVIREYALPGSELDATFAMMFDDSDPLVHFTEPGRPIYNAAVARNVAASIRSKIQDMKNNPPEAKDFGARYEVPAINDGIDNLDEEGLARHGL